MITMDYCYTKNASIIYKDLPDGPVLIDPYRRMMLRLDPVGADIWRLLDGSSSCKTIIDMLMSGYEVDEATLKRDVEVFLDALVKREIIR